MHVDDLILAVLTLWAVFLQLFTWYFITDPVPGSRWRRRFIRIRDLKPVSKILLVQKVVLTLFVVLVWVARLTGGFPGQEWFAIGLYASAAAVAAAAFIDLRILQLPREREIRKPRG